MMSIDTSYTCSTSLALLIARRSSSKSSRMTKLSPNSFASSPPQFRLRAALPKEERVLWKDQWLITLSFKLSWGTETLGDDERSYRVRPCEVMHKQRKPSERGWEDGREEGKGRERENTALIGWNHREVERKADLGEWSCLQVLASPNHFQFHF